MICSSEINNFVIFKTVRYNFIHFKLNVGFIQTELDKLRLQYEADMKQAKIEFQEKMEQTKAELDIKWQDYLRCTCYSISQLLVKTFFYYVLLNGIKIYEHNLFQTLFFNLMYKKQFLVIV